MMRVLDWVGSCDLRKNQVVALGETEHKVLLGVLSTCARTGFDCHSITRQGLMAG